MAYLDRKGRCHAADGKFAKAYRCAGTGTDTGAGAALDFAGVKGRWSWRQQGRRFVGRAPDGTEWQTNAQGEGLFRWRPDGTLQQKMGTGDTGRFTNKRAFARFVRSHFDPDYPDHRLYE